MPRMVGVLAFHLFHREISGQPRAIRRKNRIAIRSRRAIAKNVFGEKLATDLNAHAVGERSQFDSKESAASKEISN